MSTVAKSLGQFVADILSVVGAATYVPSSVVVGGIGLAGLLATASEASPIDAVAEASSPSFAELGLFVLVVAIVAAILEPLQLKITRVFEGYWGKLGLARADRYRAERKKVSDRRNELAISRRQLQQIVKIPATSENEADLDRWKRRLAAETRELRLLSAEFDRWPRSERVLPTRLGNTIRGFEDRATETLAAAAAQLPLPGNGDIHDLLPYAYFAIPQATRDSHDRFRGQVQSLATLVVVVPVVAVALAASVWHFPEGWLWGSSILGSGCLVALAALAGARDAGEGYGAMLLAISQQYVGGAFATTETTAANVQNSPTALVS